MKAIVLTYDRNAVLTEHMIQCYNELWPDHPFIFRIPYQHDDRLTSFSQREYIKSAKDIKTTVLTLLEDLDEEEWIYWCIDDKYPIQLHVQQIKEIHDSIINHELDEISSILFCRARMMLKSKYLTRDGILFGNEKLLERKAYHQIWIHQFVKVKVIRYLFLNFPDIIENAKLLDALKRKIEKPEDHKLYVTSSNHAIFGESSSYGEILANCYESMKARNIVIPSWFKIDHAKSKTIGNL